MIPSNDPITQWIINWGDSNTETIIGHPSSLQHVYADNNTYTITATAYVIGGAASAPATKSVTVQNVAPTFSVLPNSSLGESGQFSIELHYSDPGDDTLTWHVNWGDGSSIQNFPGATTRIWHDYNPDNAPYTVNITASDDDGSYALQPFSADQGDGQIYYKVSIGVEEPAYEDALVEGDLGIRPDWDYDPRDRIMDSFRVFDNPRDAVLQAVRGGVGVHRFNPPGCEPYSASFPQDLGSKFHLGEFTWDEGEFSWAAPITVSNGCGVGWDAGWEAYVTPLEITITENFANVAGETPDPVLSPGFTLYRNDAGDHTLDDLTVHLKLTGSASNADHGVPDTVQFPHGSTFVFIPLDAVDDNEPEWTEDVIVEIAPGQPIRYKPDMNKAKLEIVDNDLGLDVPDVILHANFDDDDQNNTPDYLDTHSNGADNELYPMQLSFPQERKCGARVAISTFGERVKIWDSTTKDRLLVGPGKNSYEWIICQETPPNTVYAEAIHGSVHVDDIQIILLASDATAQPPPSRDTTTTRSVNRTAIGAKLIWNKPYAIHNEENLEFEAGAHVPDVAVGHTINVAIAIEAPESYSRTYHWSKPSGDIFARWDADNTRGELVDFFDEDLNNQSIRFHWTAPGTDREVHGTVFLNGEQLAVSTKVDVLSPTVALGQFPNTFVVMGAVSIYKYPGDNTVSMGPNWATSVGPVGIWASVRVNDPIHFPSPGEFAFVSRVALSWGDQFEDLSTRHSACNAYGFQLDGSWPYFDISKAGNIGVFTDSPRNGLGQPVAKRAASESFLTYLMYKPSGDSGWVPIRRFAWAWYARAIEVQQNGNWTGNYVLDRNPPAEPGRPTSPPLQVTTEHPTWSSNANACKGTWIQP